MRTPLFRHLYKIMKSTYAAQNPQVSRASRRKFIQNAGKTALGGSLVLSLPTWACINPKMTEKKVAIVGAGMAGIRCAYELKKKGVMATVFEADKRIGGRIYSVKEAFGPGTWAEFGGEFLDNNHEDMFQLVEEFGLDIIDTYEDNAVRDVFFFEGVRKTEEQVLDSFKQILPVLEADRIACGVDFNTNRAEELDNTSLQDYIETWKTENWFKELISIAYKAEYGLDCSEQSALNLLDLIGLDIETGFLIFGDSDEAKKIVGGNQVLIEKMAETLHDQIKTEMKLQSLRHKDGMYELSFDNGERITADYVVLAIPFTALRKVDLELPKMSEEKKKCIAELGYGQNNKVMLGMRSRIWRQSKTPEAGFVFHSHLQNGWDNSQMQQANEGPAGYTVFQGGAESIAMAAEAKKAGLKDQVPNTFTQEFVQHLDAVFPGFSEHWTGNHKAALWSNHPFIEASYGCYKKGQWFAIGGLEAEPVGNVYFAGEHCSENFFGYMNGAAETGKQAAEKILLSIVSEGSSR